MRTTLNINGKKIAILTVPIENGTAVDIFETNDEYEPSNLLSQKIDNRAESVYHKELRNEATKANQFVKEHSTNQELNSDYKEELQNNT